MALNGHGGQRPGAGRPAGSANKRSQDLIAKAEASGLLPHEFLLAVVRGERIAMPAEGDDAFHVPTFAERLEAARVAAPYYAPRLAATTLSVPGGRPLDFVTQAQRDAAVAASLRADH